VTAATSIHIALHGTGRMAAAVARAAAGQRNVEVIAAVGPVAPDWQVPVRYCESLQQLEQRPDVLIDFSLPDGTATAARWCQQSKVALLSGVTGLHRGAQDGLDAAAAEVPVLWSPNMSLGVNLLAQLCARAAAVLQPTTAVVIEDLHHQWKKDAPSGTALMLGQAIGRELGADAAPIEYVSLREGEAIGRHRVAFQLGGERLELSHEALDRDIFARGALAAARWLLRQPAGRYSAADWLSRL
jgi:4-hydroxy-tetrahydrodipicolinate reductase